MKTKLCILQCKQYQFLHKHTFSYTIKHHSLTNTDGEYRRNKKTYKWFTFIWNKKHIIEYLERFYGSVRQERRQDCLHLSNQRYI